MVKGLLRMGGCIAVQCTAGAPMQGNAPKGRPWGKGPPCGATPRTAHGQSSEDLISARFANILMNIDVNLVCFHSVIPGGPAPPSMAGGPWRPKGALDSPEGDPWRLYCIALQAMQSTALGRGWPTNPFSETPNPSISSK